jgi:hypothetical protein
VEHRRQVEPVAVGVLDRDADVAGGVRTMKATSSGVASSAAKMRSPSFSRSSSSTTTTALPAAICAIARSMVSRPRRRYGSCGAAVTVSPGPAGDDPGLQQLLDVLGDHVDLEVDRVARALAAERRQPERRRDEAHLEPVVAERADGQGDAVDGDRALLDDVAAEAAGSDVRTTVQCSSGVTDSTSPVPSTWPCTTWPPRRSCTRTARSRLTGLPTCSAPSEDAAGSRPSRRR